MVFSAHDGGLWQRDRVTLQPSSKLILQVGRAPIGRSRASADPVFEPLKPARPQVTCSRDAIFS